MYTQKPLISVVIPAYNEERYIKKTLFSLQKQIYPNFEVIVVDNQSTDHTASLALAHGARVIYESRKGVAYARQAGFLVAQGSIIATTDADTVVPPDWLSRIAKQFSRTKRTVGLTGVYYFSSGSLVSQLIIRMLWSWFGRAAWEFATIGGRRAFLIGSNCAVRKDAFMACGGFNTDLAALEDWDLGMRIRKLGRVKFDPSILVCTSGRRFSHGFLPGLSHYAYNYIAWIVLKQPALTRFRDIRYERSAVGNAIAFTIAVCLCFFGYAALFRPQFVAQAKIMKTVGTQIKFVTTMVQTNVWKATKAPF